MTATSGTTTLYISRRREPIEKIIRTNHIGTGELECRQYKDVLLLPCKKAKTIGANIVYAGGVCTKNFDFIAGLARHDTNTTLSYTVCSAYPLPKTDTLEHLPACIFGGVLIEIFGHTLTETLTRLWFVPKKLYEDLPIIFVNTGPTIPKHFTAILDLLNIRDRVRVITTPIAVDTVFVPDQSIILYSRLYREYFGGIYASMAENAKKQCRELFSSPKKKIYLTRSHFAKNDCLAEQIFEDIYRDNGFTVIALEEYSLAQQIVLLSNAEEIVSTVGTLSHMAILFCRETTKITFLLRENESGALTPQLIINKLKHCPINIIDSTYNFLPTTHAGGIFLLCPNENFKKYALDNNYVYDEENVAKRFSPYILSYLRQYATNYSRHGYAFKRLKHLDFFDIVSRLATVVLNKDIKRADFQTESKKALEDKVACLTNIVGQPDISELQSALDMEHTRATTSKRTLFVNADDTTIFASTLSIPLAPAIDSIKEKFPLFSDHCREIVPLLYTGFHLDVASYDLLVLNQPASNICLSKDCCARIAESSLDAVFYTIFFKGPLHTQYIACHGRASWQILQRVLDEDPFVSAVATHSGYAINYVFARNFCIVRPHAFKTFFAWYLTNMTRIVGALAEADTKYVPQISERLMTLYFYAHSFKRLRIGYFTKA